jgi:hypothetical protein
MNDIVNANLIGPGRGRASQVSNEVNNLIHIQQTFICYSRRILAVASMKAASYTRRLVRGDVA